MSHLFLGNAYKSVDIIIWRGSSESGDSPGVIHFTVGALEGLRSTGGEKFSEHAIGLAALIQLETKRPKELQMNREQLQSIFFDRFSLRSRSGHQALLQV